jgi:hypothetical protein
MPNFFARYIRILMSLACKLCTLNFNFIFHSDTFHFNNLRAVRFGTDKFHTRLHKRKAN